MLLSAPVFQFSASAAEPQSDPVSFIQQFSALQTDLPRERIHLHTDRPSYFQGDRIWFSAYVLGGPNNAFSGISSVLYVDLYDGEGNRVDRSIVRLSEGRGQGVLIAEEGTGEPGHYEIVAFTAWGLNFGTSYAYRKSLMIHSGENMMALDSDAVSSGAERITFFPEGGALIPGASSMVGFTAEDENGMPVNLEGYLVKDDERISEIETFYPGFGKLSFSPEAGSTYSIETEGRFFELPAVESGSEHYRLSAGLDDSGQFVIRLDAADTSVNGPVVFMGHVRGQLYHAGEIFMQNGRGMTWVSPDLFPSGIIHFAAIGEDARVLSTRAVLNINPIDQSTAEIAIEDEVVSRRARVEPVISLKDHEGNPVRGIVSFTVYDESAAPLSSYGQKEIKDGLLFAPELDTPLWYGGPSLSEASVELREALLLTSVGNVFDYEAVFSTDNITLYSLPENGFTISGDVRGGLLTSGVGGSTVVVSIGEDDDQLLVLEADEDGNFAIDDLEIIGRERIQVRGPDTRGIGHSRVRLNPQFEHLPLMGRPLPQAAMLDRLVPVTGETITMAERTTMARVDTEAFIIAETELETVTITAERIDDDEQRRRIATGDAGGREIRVEDNPQLQSLGILEVIQRLPGVTVAGDNIRMNIGGVSLSGTNPPLILLDGMETEVELLRGLSASDVATVISLRRPDELARFGAQGANGVISIRSVRGRQIQRPDTQMLVAFAEGYDEPLPFLSPRYGGALRDDERTDARITLHYEPEIQIGRNGQSVLFWTGDVPGTYRIEVEGITEDGVPFSGSSRIVVE